MSRISTRIRAYVDDPSVSDHYGEWGILRADQRRLIRKLCDVCDAFEKTADRLIKENERLKSIVLAFTNEVVIDGNGYYIKDLSYEKIAYNAKKCLASIKAESYKECLEKIEQRDVSESDFYIMVKKTEFDNLLKEKVGEDNA